MVVLWAQGSPNAREDFRKQIGDSNTQEALPRGTILAHQQSCHQFQPANTLLAEPGRDNQQNQSPSSKAGRQDTCLPLPSLPTLGPLQGVPLASSPSDSQLRCRQKPAPITYRFLSALALLQLAPPHFSQPTSIPLQHSSDRARVMEVPTKPCVPAAAPATHRRWRGMLKSTELRRDRQKCQSSFYL